MLKRCDWCLRDDLYMNYHDKEWGVPVHNDRLLFEFLILEGAQAGLSWHTVLKKREAYRLAFDDFDPEKVARYHADKIQELMTNPGIIRNQLKIKASVQNAQAFLKVQEHSGSFDQYIWNFVDGKPIQNHYKTLAELPAETELSRLISKELKKKGFNFVGPTIVYAHMQATGMVNDHLVDCYRHRELSAGN
jgi:DNA-3-methyladenine glycosylase I